MYFDKNVQFLRKKNKLSQQQFGDIFSVTNKAVYKWESGLSTPDIETINKIADYFNIDLDTICNVDLSNENTVKKSPKKLPFLKYLPPVCVLLAVGISMSVILPWAFKEGSINSSTPIPGQNTDNPIDKPGDDPVEPIDPPTPPASELTYTVDSIKLEKNTTLSTINYNVRVTLSDVNKTIDYLDLELLSRYSYSRTVDEVTEKGSTYVVYSKDEVIKSSLGEGKFLLSLDVTNLPNNGSWFFPKLYVGDTVDELTNVDNPFGNSIVTDLSTYRIMQTNSTNNRPLVTRQSKSSDVPEGASFSFEKGEIKLVNNRPQVTLSGTATSYTFETLSTQLGYQIKHSGGTNNEYVEFNITLNSCPRLSMEEDKFYLSYFVDGFDKNSYPYYSRFKTTSSGSLVDFNQTNCPNFTINKGENVISNGYKYEILWANGTGAVNAYNTFGVKISKI